MKQLVKNVSAIALAVIVCISGALSASALTYHGSEQTRKTSGGTGPVITVKARVFTDTYRPASSTTSYQYGVLAWVADNSNIYTNFSVKGTLSKPSSSTNFSGSEYGNGIKAYATATAPDVYEYCSSTISATSSYYGSCTFSCNASLK